MNRSQEDIPGFAIGGIPANRPVCRTDDVQAGNDGFEFLGVSNEVLALPTTCVHGMLKAQGNIIALRRLWLQARPVFCKNDGGKVVT